MWCRISTSWELFWKTSPLTIAIEITTNERLLTTSIVEDAVSTVDVASQLKATILSCIQQLKLDMTWNAISNNTRYMKSTQLRIQQIVICTVFYSIVRYMRIFQVVEFSTHTTISHRIQQHWYLNNKFSYLFTLQYIPSNATRYNISMHSLAFNNSVTCTVFSLFIYLLLLEVGNTRWRFEFKLR